MLELVAALTMDDEPRADTRNISAAGTTCRAARGILPLHHSLLAQISRDACAGHGWPGCLASGICGAVDGFSYGVGMVANLDWHERSNVESPWAYFTALPESLL